MKTIEEAAHELWRKEYIGEIDHNEYDEIFRSGVEFAQRWIPVKEELPPIREKVLGLYKDYENMDYVFLVYFRGGEDELSFVTHWRPINFK